MKADKFNAGAECVNITLYGVPKTDGIEWTLSAANTDELTAADWDDIFYRLRQLKGE